MARWPDRERRLGGLVSPALAAWLGTGLACAAAPPPEPVAATAAHAASAVGEAQATVAPAPPLPGAATSAEPPAGTRSDDPAATAVAPEEPGAGGAGEKAVAERSRPIRRELIVIDAGSSPVRPDPVELARATRRGTAGSDSPTISNENLAEYGRDARVTMSEGAGEEGADASAATPPQTDALTDEEYWRRSAREIREAWRRTADDIATLEETAADLRWRFYAADDPWARDRQIKPEWDRVLERLTAARQELAEFPQRIDDLVERGRREGALPGWLREGIELEPRDPAPDDDQPGTSEPVEPPELDEGRPGERGGTA